LVIYDLPDGNDCIRIFLVLVYLKVGVK
jgi:hypothetical protein